MQTAIEAREELGLEEPARGPANPAPELISKGAIQNDFSGPVMLVEQPATGLLAMLKESPGSNRPRDSLTSIEKEAMLINRLLRQGCDTVPAFALKISESPSQVLYEYIPTELKDYVGAGLPTDRAWAAFKDVCSSLEALHAGGPPCFHGELQPASFRVTESGRVKLVSLDRVTGIDPRYTVFRDRSQSGSARWAAPEQLEGTATAADAKIDVYQAGELLYYLLTGEEIPRGEALDDERVSEAVADVIKRAIGPRAARFESIKELREAAAAALEEHSAGPAEYLRKLRSERVALRDECFAARPDELPMSQAKIEDAAVVCSAQIASEGNAVAISPDLSFAAYSEGAKLWILSLEQPSLKTAAPMNADLFAFRPSDGRLLLAKGSHVYEYKVTKPEGCFRIGMEKVAHRKLKYHPISGITDAHTVFGRSTECIGLSPEGALAYGYRKGVLVKFDLREQAENGSPNPVATYPCDEKPALTVSEHGDYLSTSRGGQLHWICSKNTAFSWIYGEIQGKPSYSPDGNGFAFAEPRGKGVVLKLAAAGLNAFTEIPLPVSECAHTFSHDGASILVGGADGILRQCKVGAQAGPSRIESFRGFPDPIIGLELIPNSPLIAVRTTQNLYVLDMSPKKQHEQGKADAAPPKALSSNT